MGVDLIGRRNSRFSAGAWDYCLEVAVAFGWKPAGTVTPLDFSGEWSGTYCSNDFQIVTDKDARALAAALHRAIFALSTNQTQTENQTKACKGGSVELLRELADFADEGTFAIL